MERRFQTGFGTLRRPKHAHRRRSGSHPPLDAHLHSTWRAGCFLRRSRNRPCIAFPAFLSDSASLWLILHCAGYNRGMRTTQKSPQIHGTTVLCVRRDNKVVLAADGQVTLGDGVMKHNAKKTRRLFNDKIVAGFAGSTADALSLFSRFENKLQEYHGNLPRAA